MRSGRVFWPHVWVPSAFGGPYSSRALVLASRGQTVAPLPSARCRAEFFTEVAGAHECGVIINFAFRVFGMSPTNKTSLGASALPSWAANAFSKL